MTNPTTELAYQEALDFLYRFIDHSLTRNLRNAPGRFDLSRMDALMAALGRPERAYPVIHIAGTKGKGSTAALCAAALQAAGYKVGLYTSPHLEDFAERIQVNGRPLPHADLPPLVDWLRPLTERIPQLTTFELTTAAAFLYFAQQQVDVAVIEVGLGGRLDATNIVQPLVTVITPISLDHTAILGNTLASIAREKAGILKPGAPLALAPQPPEARQTILHIAQERGVPVTEVGRDFFFAPLARSLAGQVVGVWPAQDQAGIAAFVEGGGFEEAWEPTRLRIPLLGPHQAVNAATAYVALRLAHRQGLTVPEAAIREGFAQARWPARFEVLHLNPPLVVDGAHNVHAARQVRLTVDEYFPDWPLVLIFGASEDKDIPGMLAELLPRAREVIFTQAVHPRALETEALARYAAPFGKPVFQATPPAAALELALQRAAGEALILATGSLFVAASVRIAWRERQPYRWLLPIA